MEVILLQDVAKLGRRFDIVTVPAGHGLNKLIPSGMAMPATPENRKRIEAQSAKTDAERAAGEVAFADVVAKLTEAVTVSAEASEEGKLYQAVAAETVVEALSAAVGQPVAENWLVIGDPIKTTGDHTVELTTGDQSHQVTITVA